MFKKIIISIVLASFIFVNAGVYFVNTIKAQEGTWYYQDWPDWYARVYDDENPDEIFGERYTAAQVEWVIWGLFAFFLNHVVESQGLMGCLIGEAWTDHDFLRCVPILEAVLDLLNLASAEQNSVMLAETNPVDDIISGARPISGIGYIRNAAAKFNIVGEVHAQGFGFDAASSIRQLWVTIRNVTYFFLVLMIIGMAFLIMFRFKINPQTVITIQSALPKIIIALILITFSYAIAGFLIDLMYVVIGLIAAILSESGLFNLEWGPMYDRLTGETFGQGILGTMNIYTIFFFVTAILSLFTLDLGFNTLFSFLLPIIVVVVAIALLIITIKIIWMLVKTYVTVILLIAVGPIYIITGGFGKWLRNLASNLAVFVAIGPMFAISYLFLGAALPTDGAVGQVIFDLLSGIVPFSPEPGAISGSAWMPPYLGIGNENVIWLFASFIVITLIPNVANIIKSTVAGKPFGYGTAIGAAIGAGAGVAAYPFQSAWGATSDARRKAFTEMIQTRSVEPLKEMFRRRRA